MKLYIKNMVCNRCIMVVKNELDKFHYQTVKITLGDIELKESITKEEKVVLNEHLKAFGFEIIDDKKSKLITQVKTSIIDCVQNENGNLAINLSTQLSNSLNHDYSYLSNLFSEVEGTTIEKYFIAQKIEKVKELLVYGELSLSEIANLLNYSSVAYLSNQFKKVTGLTPTFFKNLKVNKRKSLDKV